MLIFILGMIPGAIITGRSFWMDTIEPYRDTCGVHGDDYAMTALVAVCGALMWPIALPVIGVSLIAERGTKEQRRVKKRTMMEARHKAQLRAAQDTWEKLNREAAVRLGEKQTKNLRELREWDREAKLIENPMLEVEEMQRKAQAMLKWEQAQRERSYLRDNDYEIRNMAGEVVSTSRVVHYGTNKAVCMDASASGYVFTSHTEDVTCISCRDFALRHQRPTTNYLR